MADKLNPDEAIPFEEVDTSVCTLKNSPGVVFLTVGSVSLAMTGFDARAIGNALFRAGCDADNEARAAGLTVENPVRPNE